MANMNDGTSSELDQLLAQQAELEQKIATLKRQAREQALAEARKLIALYAFSPSELGLGKAAKQSEQRRKATPKYRDPVTGATWSGRGRAPTWIAQKERSAFLIS